MTFENPTFNGSAITVTLGKLPDGIKRVMVGYTRLDLGVPVEGKYVNLPECGKTTFHSLVSGTKYRITAWGLGGGSNRKRCQSPTEVEVTTRSKGGCLLDLQYNIVSIFPLILLSLTKHTIIIINNSMYVVCNL